MTRVEFLNECLTFTPGQIVVVSSPDITLVTSLLEEARTAIEASTPNLVLVYDSRKTILYSKRDQEENVTQAIIWEYISIMAEGNFVVLVANHFDPADTRHNPNPSGLEADVVLDLMNSARIRDLKYAYHSKYGIREIYAFISKMYYFDHVADEVAFIKNQTPDRP
jgi:hypothetical protein